MLATQPFQQCLHLAKLGFYIATIARRTTPPSEQSGHEAIERIVRTHNAVALLDPVALIVFGGSLSQPALLSQYPAQRSVQVRQPRRRQTHRFSKQLLRRFILASTSF